MTTQTSQAPSSKQPNAGDPTRPGLRARLRWWLAHPGAILSRVAGEIYKLRHPDEPWISNGAVQFCAANLSSGMRGLEWGSGRSTVWFGKRLGKLTSVEHAEPWHRIVSGKLRQGGLHVDYRYVPLDHAVQEPTVPHYDPVPAYVRVASEFDPESLDFVVVDGHYRQACIRAVLPKLRSGGLLLVDNTNWMSLSEWGVPADWPVVHRSMGFESETTIWRKP